MVIKRVILVLFMIFCAIYLYAQKNINEGIKFIEEKYGFNFVYDSSLTFDKAIGKSILNGKSIEEDLNTLFINSDIEWQIKGNYIILKRRPQYNISGVIRDAESYETLVGATIVEEKTLRGAYTNNQGLFSYRTYKGRKRLIVDYIGYYTKEIDLDLLCDTTIYIDMQRKATALKEVVIRSSLETSERAAFLNKHGSVAINIDKMNYMPSIGGGQDIFKYIQTVSGVSSGSDGSSELYIRGGLSDQTQILLDDVPIYNQSHAFGYVSIFSAEAVKSAILHKGYTSPQYGGRLSGVVDLTMKDGNRKGHKQSFQLGLTTSSVNAEGYIDGGRGSYLFSGRFFTLYPFLKLGYAFIPDDSRSGAPSFGFFDLVGKITYDLSDKHKLTLSSYSGNDSFGIEYNSSSNTLVSQDNSETSQSHFSESESKMSWGNSVASLRLRSRVNNKLFATNTLYYSYLGNNVSTNYNDSKRSYNANIKSKLDEFGYKSDFDYHLSNLYWVDFGGQFTSQQFRPQTMSSQTDSGVEKYGTFSEKILRTYTLYLNNNLNFGKVDIDLGARGVIYDNGSKTQSAIEPRISISYMANDNLSLWSSYTQNNQALFSLNKHYFSVPIDYWVPYVDNQIQSSNQYSIGVKYGENKPFTFAAEFYYKQTSDLTMIYDSDEFLLTGEGYDRGDGEAFGTEFIAQYNMDRFSTVLSYSYSKSDLIIDGIRRPYPYDTPHSANLLTMYTVKNNTKKKQTLAVNIAYKSGRPFPIYDEMYESVSGEIFYGNVNIVHYSKLNTARLRDYFRADIGYSFEKKLKKGSRIWQFSITNFTNHKNPYIILSDSDSNIEVTSEREFKAFTLIPFLPSFSYTRFF